MNELKGCSEMAKIKLYTTHCPKCNVLASKLKEKGVEFEEVTDISVMESLGIENVPALQIDIRDFSEAVKFVNQLEVPNK